MKDLNKKIGASLLTALVAAGTITVPVANAAESETTPSIFAQAHVQNIGWNKTVQDVVSESVAEKLIGTTGKGLRIEALKMHLEGIENASLTFDVHIQNLGWKRGLKEDDLVGTTGKGLRLEALVINATGLEEQGYKLQYKAHVQNLGWDKTWKDAGDQVGTTGKGLRLEAIQVRIVVDLTKVKEDATKEVEALLTGIDSYSATNQKSINDIVTAAKSDITGATTKEAVDTAVAAAKAGVEKVAALETAQKAANTKLAGYKAVLKEELAEADYKKIEKTVDTAMTEINTAETVEKVEELYSAAEKAVKQASPTVDAVMAKAEEARVVAREELADYAELVESLEAEKKLTANEAAILKGIVADAGKQVEAAATEAKVKTAATDAKRLISSNANVDLAIKKQAAAEKLEAYLEKTTNKAIVASINNYVAEIAKIEKPTDLADYFAKANAIVDNQVKTMDEIKVYEDTLAKTTNISTSKKKAIENSIATAKTAVEEATIDSLNKLKDEEGKVEISSDPDVDINPHFTTIKNTLKKAVNDIASNFAGEQAKESALTKAAEAVEKITPYVSSENYEDLTISKTADLKKVVNYTYGETVLGVVDDKTEIAAGTYDCAIKDEANQYLKLLNDAVKDLKDNKVADDNISLAQAVTNLIALFEDKTVTLDSDPVVIEDLDGTGAYARLAFLTRVHEVYEDEQVALYTIERVNANQTLDQYASAIAANTKLTAEQVAKMNDLIENTRANIAARTTAKAVTDDMDLFTATIEAYSADVMESTFNKAKADAIAKLEAYEESEVSYNGTAVATTATKAKDAIELMDFSKGDTIKAVNAKLNTAIETIEEITENAALEKEVKDAKTTSIAKFNKYITNENVNVQKLASAAMNDITNVKDSTPDELATAIDSINEIEKAAMTEINKILDQEDLSEDEKLTKARTDALAVVKKYKDIATELKATKIVTDLETVYEAEINKEDATLDTIAEVLVDLTKYVEADKTKEGLQLNAIYKYTNYDVDKEIEAALKEYDAKGTVHEQLNDALRLYKNASVTAADKKTVADGVSSAITAIKAATTKDAASKAVGQADTDIEELLTGIVDLEVEKIEKAKELDTEATTAANGDPVYEKIYKGLIADPIEKIKAVTVAENKDFEEKNKDENGDPTGIDKIESIVEKAKEDIKKKTQLDTTALATAITNAKTTLANYATTVLGGITTGDDYDKIIAIVTTDGSGEITGTGATNIDAAKNEVAVATALENAKKDIDQIVTDAKTTAKTELASYASTIEGTGTTTPAITAIVTTDADDKITGTGATAIDNATTIKGINDALTAQKAAIDKVLSDAKAKKVEDTEKLVSAFLNEKDETKEALYNKVYEQTYDGTNSVKKIIDDKKTEIDGIKTMKALNEFVSLTEDDIIAATQSAAEAYIQATYTDDAEGNRTAVLGNITSATTVSTVLTAVEGASGTCTPQ